MNLGQRIRRGVTWLLVGNTGGQVLQFAFGIALARLLVPADFGMVVTIQIFTGFVGMLATGGMGQSLVRAKDASKEDFNAVFTLQLCLGALIFVGFFLVAPWIAEYLDNPSYADLLRVSALSFVFRPFALIRGSWLNREMQFKRMALVTLVAGAVSGVAGVLMAVGGMGVWSLILAGLASALASNLLLARLTPLRLRLRFDGDAVRRHSGFGLKITTNDFLQYLQFEGINLILSKMAGPAFLGLFNKAESLARLPNRLITPATGQTMFRAMSAVQDDLDKTKYMFHRAITLLSVYIYPGLVGLWWIAESFIEVLYGAKWLPAAEPMRILVVAALMRPINNQCGVLLAAQNRLGQEMIGLAIGVVLAMTACMVGLRWGLAGVAWAYALSGAFSTTFNYVLVHRAIPTRVSDLLKAMVPALLLSAILVVALAITHSLAGHLKSSAPALYLAVMVLCGVLVYGSAFLFLPIAALRAEAARWRQAIRLLLPLASRGGT